MIIDNLAAGQAFDLALARNTMVVNIPAYDVAGIADRSSIDYYLEVYVPEFPGSNEYLLLETLEAKESPKKVEGAIETYNGAFFEIDDLLRSFLKATPPDYAQSQIKVLPYNTTPYYCKLIVKVDGVTDYTEDLPPGTAAFAGVAERDWADYNDVFFSDWVGKERRFLTYKPVDNVIGADQPELLYWLHNYSDSIDVLNVKVVATTAAGTEITGIALTLANVSPMKVYSIPVGLPVLSSIHNERAQIVKYTIWLTDENGDRVSEVRTYTIDKVYRRNTRYVYFLNSLGVYDCLRITGTGAEGLDMEVTTGEQFTGYSYLAKYAEKVITDKVASRTLTVELQWSEKRVARYLTDFALSRDYYVVSDRELWPMMLQNSTYIPEDDNEDWAGRQFVFLYSNSQRFYSELPKVGQKASRETRWVPLGVSCELDSKGKYTGKQIITMLELVYADDMSLVIPRKTKPNTPNEDGYVEPLISADCENTPFLSEEISRQTTFKKDNCTGGQVGESALLVVAAGRWGSTISQADANAKAEAEWQVLNTQAYANANGSCSTIGVYNPAGGVPVGRFWVRFESFSAADTNLTGISAIYVGDSRPGNMWFNSGSTQANKTDVYPTNTWDVSFPAARVYEFYLYLHNGNTGKTVKIYVDGVLIDEYVANSSFEKFAFPKVPVSGEKWYIQVL